MRKFIDQRLILDCVGMDLEGRGQLAVRFAKAIVHEDGRIERMRSGDKLLVFRHTLEPGDDIDAMIDLITPTSRSIGFDPPSQEDVDKLKRIAAAIWTPDVLMKRSQIWADWAKDYPQIPVMEAIKIDSRQRLEASFVDW